ncbi:MAG: hypothetical protein J3R72DRAFT_473311 [Linnemannia gamsii]|nr:MAG: hypothetical protein J3R72DRAFT_473311 [Linnemannia gamsii]
MTLSVLPLEILHLIGSYLLPVDLLQCVIVSREWNTVFIPMLWHTIDSDRSTWRKILHEYDSEHVRGHKDEQWIQALFNKYAHHIRCLKVYDRDIFRFVGQSGTCTRLESLEVFELGGSDTLKELADLQYNIDYGVGASSVDECEEAGFKGPVLSSLFEGAFEPNEAGCGSLTSQKRDWFAHQHFWLLAMTNPGLRLLKVHRNLWMLSRLKRESGLNLKILSSLKNLVTMEDPFSEQRLAAILESVPKARHLRLEKVELEPALEVTYPHLETIVMLDTSAHIRQLFSVLKRLPNLTYLRFGRVHMKGYEYFDEELDDWVDPIEEPFGFEEARAVLGGVHGRLERLDLGYSFRYADIEPFLPLFPMLKPRDMLQPRVE